MSAGPSLYRRHRPRTFAEVVGQEHVVRTLSHAVERGMVHHAYLFVGSRGTGKTSMAKILAACLNCEQGPTTSPCGACESCTAIASATSLDVIEMDAASNNSVDDIRDLREKVAFAPVSGRHKVYILDEAHMLSQQAWNAFLKTLEEPPPRTIFVLATTEAQKVLPTVVDRCHRFDFGRPTATQVATVVRRVAELESIDLDPAAVALVARHAAGSFRDALGTLEQLVTFSAGERIEPRDVLDVLGVADAEQLFSAIEAVVARDPATAIRAAGQLVASGRDPGQVLRDLEVHARELLTVQILGEVPPELRVTPERDARLETQARAVTESDSVRLLELVGQALSATADGAQPQIQLELVLIKAAQPELEPTTQALLARIERLENQLRAAGAGNGAAPIASTRAPVVEERPQPETVEERPQPETVEEQPQPETVEEQPQPETVEERPQPETVEEQPRPEMVEEQRQPEPRAAAAPDTKGAAAQEQPELDSIAALWPAVVDTVRSKNALLAALLDGARPAAVDDRSLTLAFAPEAAFLKKKAEQDEYRRTAAEALRSVTGHALALQYELAAEAVHAGPAGGPATPPVHDEEELVRRLIEEFDAQELQQPERDEKAE